MLANEWRDGGDVLVTERTRRLVNHFTRGRQHIRQAGQEHIKA